MTTHSHHDNVEKQFGSQANAYLHSAVHAAGRDLARLAQRLSDFSHASVLDMGCGAGHASFVAAQHANSVVAYDLSASMLEVVAGAAEERHLSNITLRQGYAEKLPFEDASFEVVISRYDIWLQTVEALRDTSHVRNYSSGEWLAMVNNAMLVTNTVITDRLSLEFRSWVTRMRTPAPLVEAIRLYQASAPVEVKRYFELQDDGSFSSDTIMLEAHKAV